MDGAASSALAGIFAAAIDLADKVTPAATPGIDGATAGAIGMSVSSVLRDLQDRLEQVPSIVDIPPDVLTCLKTLARIVRATRTDCIAYGDVALYLARSDMRSVAREGWQALIRSRPKNQGLLAWADDSTSALMPEAKIDMRAPIYGDVREREPDLDTVWFGPAPVPDFSLVVEVSHPQWEWPHPNWPPVGWKTDKCGRDWSIRAFRQWLQFMAGPGGVLCCEACMPGAGSFRDVIHDAALWLAILKRNGDVASELLLGDPQSREEAIVALLELDGALAGHGREAQVPAESAADSSTKIEAKSQVAPTRQKRSTERGEGRAKLIAALTKHHKYRDDSCLNLEPIGNNDLARKADVEESTASDFFRKHFKGHSRYKILCREPAQLIAAIKLLNGEFSPHNLYGAKPPGEEDRDN